MFDKIGTILDKKKLFRSICQLFYRDTCQNLYLYSLYTVKHNTSK